MPFERRWQRAQGDTATDATSAVVLIGMVDPLLKAALPVLRSRLLDALGAQALTDRVAPFAVQVMLALLWIEFAKYWSHRWHHTLPAAVVAARAAPRQPAPLLAEQLPLPSAEPCNQHWPRACCRCGCSALPPERAARCHRGDAAGADAAACQRRPAQRLAEPRVQHQRAASLAPLEPSRTRRTRTSAARSCCGTRCSAPTEPPSRRRRYRSGCSATAAAILRRARTCASSSRCFNLPVAASHDHQRPHPLHPQLGAQRAGEACSTTGRSSSARTCAPSAPAARPSGRHQSVRDRGAAAAPASTPPAYRSKSWDEFAGRDAPRDARRHHRVRQRGGRDSARTGPAARCKVHWGYADPSNAPGGDDGKRLRLRADAPGDRLPHAAAAAAAAATRWATPSCSAALQRIGAELTGAATCRASCSPKRSAPRCCWPS